MNALVRCRLWLLLPLLLGCSRPGNDADAEILRRAFEPGEDFEALPPPAFGDWLEQHAEKGQTFEQFARSGAVRRDHRRDTLYLQPLGEFPAGQGPPLSRLQEFASIFFGVEARLLPTMRYDDLAVASRLDPVSRRHRQYRTSEILHLLPRYLPEDGIALLGVTLEDVYPEPSWNYVFGQASLSNRVGIYSFARYDPRFWGEPRQEGWRTLVLQRSCKVLAHEAGHMFGIRHCTAFRCVMNGSNHLAELDTRPLHLCPVDLRKLHSSLGFDILDRYRRLREFSEAAGFQDEADWYRRRIHRLTTAAEH